MKIGYTLFGQGPERVMVLHDWPGDARIYHLVWPHLNLEKFTYAFMDLRGHGKSRHISGHYTLEESVQDALKLAGDLGWEEFHVVGHSLTTLVAQKLSLMEGRILSSVLLSPLSPEGLPLGSWGMEILRRYLQEYQAMLQGAEEKEPTLQKAVQGHLLMFMQNLTKGNGWDKRTSVSPFLLVVGEYEQDCFPFERIKDIFGTHYPRVELFLCPGASSYSMLTSPQLLTVEMEKFLLKNSRSG